VGGALGGCNREDRSRVLRSSIMGGLKNSYLFIKTGLPHCECGCQKASIYGKCLCVYALRSIYDQEISLYVGGVLLGP